MNVIYFMFALIYLLANGTFAVEDLVTQTSAGGQSEDLKTTTTTEHSVYNEPIEVGAPDNLEKNALEDPVNNLNLAAPGDNQSEEDKEADGSVQDSEDQSSVNEKHTDTETVSEKVNESPAAVPDTGVEDVISDSSVQSGEHHSTSDPSTLGEQHHESDEPSSAPSADQMGTLEDHFGTTNLGSIPPRKDDPEEIYSLHQEITTESPPVIINHGEGINSQEATGNDKAPEIPITVTNYTPKDHIDEKDTQSLENDGEENSDISETDPEQNNNIHQDKVEDEQNLPSNTEENITDEINNNPTGSILEHENNSDTISKVDIKPDNISEGGSNDSSVKGDDTQPEIQKLESINILTPEESGNIVSSDQTKDSDLSSHSGSETVTTLPNIDETITEKSNEEPNNDKKHEADSTIDNSNQILHHIQGDLQGSTQKEPIPPRKDDSVPEEIEQPPQHPDQSFTKTQDYSPDSQTQSAILDSEPSQQIITDDHTIIPTSNEDVSHPSVAIADNPVTQNEVKDDNLELTNPEKELIAHDSETSDPDIPTSELQEVQAPGLESTEDTTNVEDQTIPPVSNVVSDVVGNGPNEITHDETELASVAEPTKPLKNEVELNLIPTESGQEVTNDLNQQNIDKEEDGTDRPLVHENADNTSDDKENESVGVNTQSIDKDNSQSEKHSEFSQDSLEEVHPEEEKENTQQISGSNIVDSLSTGNENVYSESSTKESDQITLEGSTVKIQPDVPEVQKTSEEQPSATTLDPLLTNDSTFNAPVVPSESDAAVHKTPEVSGLEETSSKDAANQTKTVVDTEESETELPTKDANENTDVSLKPEEGLKNERGESEEKVSDGSSSENKHIESSENNVSPSEHSHSESEKDIGEAELQEVPHDPVESDPIDFEEEDSPAQNTAEHQSPTENEIVDEVSGSGAGLVEHNTPVVSGPIVGIPGEGDCLVDGKTYTNNTLIPSKSPCHKECTCISSIVHCQGIDCPPPPPELANCMPVHQGDLCCPVYTCGKCLLPL